MAFGPLQTIIQTLIQGSNSVSTEIPLSQVYSPEDNLNLLQGGPSSTDSANSKKSPPAAVYPSAGKTATHTSVAASASSVSLLAANANRKFYAVYNDSSAVLYLALVATASTTAYYTQVPPNTLYEMPRSHTWTGIVSGIRASATGNARITEVS